MNEWTEPVRVRNTTRWAERVGYCRAIRVGARIHVSGTAAVGEDGRIGPEGDAYGQARRCLVIIQAALAELGAGPEHVVRTRVYIREASDWEAVGRAHGEVFAATPPASTMVVTAFIEPAMLVEIEADAIAPH